MSISYTFTKFTDIGPTLKRYLLLLVMMVVMMTIIGHLKTINETETKTFVACFPLETWHRTD